MKNWKIPSIILAILILTFTFRWGDLGSTTNNGTTVKTKVDHWNGSIWQDTIKNGSYVESMINSGWIEASRKSIDKQVEYKKPIYTKSENASKDTSAGKLQYLIDEQRVEFTEKVNSSSGDEYNYSTLREIPGYTKNYEMRTKTIQEAPTPIYWLSSNGLTKIWTYVTSVIGIWLIVAFVMTQRKKQKTMKK